MIIGAMGDEGFISPNLSVLFFYCHMTRVILGVKQTLLCDIFPFYCNALLSNSEVLSYTSHRSDRYQRTFMQSAVTFTAMRKQSYQLLLQILKTSLHILYR